MNKKKSRRPLYLSRDKDEDILNYIEPLLMKYNFSATVRELIRDGIKYREQSKQSIEHMSVLQSNTHPDLSDIKLKKKEVSLQELESRFDDF